MPPALLPRGASFRESERPLELSLELTILGIAPTGPHSGRYEPNGQRDAGLDVRSEPVWATPQGMLCLIQFRMSSSPRSSFPQAGVDPCVVVLYLLEALVWWSHVPRCCSAPRFGSRTIASPESHFISVHRDAIVLAGASCNGVCPRDLRVWSDWDEYVIAGNGGVIPWAVAAMACCAVRPAPLDATSRRR